MFNVPTKNSPELAKVILDYMEYYGYENKQRAARHTHVAVDFKSRAAYTAIEYNEYPVVTMDSIFKDKKVPERYFQVHNNIVYIQAIASRLEDLGYTIPFRNNKDAETFIIYTRGRRVYYTESFTGRSRYFNSTLEDLY